MLYIYAFTIFIGSTLLFLIEPMFAKMVLPLLGGSPAVWNTCMVFFQMALLGGYAYTHFSTTRLGVRKQIIVHLILILLPLIFLPIALPAGWIPPIEANPVPWLLAIMLVSVGVPFFVVSSSATMIQRWFSCTNHANRNDPYFLYAASNIGSFTGLIGYIVFFEPRFTLSIQSKFWEYGYISLILLTAACAWWVLKKPGDSSQTHDIEQASDGDINIPSERPALSRRLRWIVLAFIPSSLMLGVTTYITTDVASVPLLWVIPLSLYLFTFILAFSGKSFLPDTSKFRLFPMMVLIQMVVLSSATLPPPWNPVLHLITFAVVAMLCHGELAKDRPNTRYMTEFYLLLSVGGALGGLFNALLAPVIFNSVIEYPIVLVLAALFYPRSSENSNEPAFKLTDLVLPIGLAGLTAGALFFAHSHNTNLPPKVLALGLGIVAILCFSFVNRPLRFGVGLGAVITVITIYPMTNEHILLQERDFFGVLKVKTIQGQNATQLVHGTTLHGMQSSLPSKSRLPLTYYHPSGPIGQVFTSCVGDKKNVNIALIGLGAGTLAAYADAGQNFTFYEIDPQVLRVASNTGYFTYLTDARKRGANVKVILGDARLTIQRAPKNEYDLIVLDAFSSDSIPVHLLTKQALDIYVSKLKPQGIIALHISNRYLDLTTIVANLAYDANLMPFDQFDKKASKEEIAIGKSVSHWMLITHQENDLGKLTENKRWRQVHGKREDKIWTDDFSNILQSIKWN